jgi:hypothetical protein
MIDWIITDLDMAAAEGSMSDRDASVIRVYIDDFVRTHVGMMDNDAGFVKYFNQVNKVGITLTRQQFSNLRGLYLERVHKRLETDPPQWYIDLSNEVFLAAAQKGRGRFAGMNHTAAEKVLRGKLIRLAHANPALRPHLLPLIKSAGCEKLPEGPMRDNCENKKDEGEKADKKADAEGPEAGRTWGNPDPGAPHDWDHPYAHHKGHPPAGTDGSAQRKRYNNWYRENVCKTEHATGCGRDWD